MNPERVVSDASPLIALEQIDCLALLSAAVIDNALSAAGET
jgi:hypothetical protein